MMMWVIFLMIAWRINGFLLFLHADITDHTDLVRGGALTVFEHESHELNEYFIAHGSHGSHGSFCFRQFLTMRFLDF